MNDYELDSILAEEYASTIQCDEDIHADLSGDEYADAVLSTLSWQTATLRGMM